MRINEIRTLAGPNIYSHQPVLRMTLDLENLSGKESFEITGFVDRLLGLLPGLPSHHCSKGRPEGFVERLHEGTYFGHIVEHIALELTDLAGAPVFHGKTRKTDEPGHYNIAIEYKAEQGTRFLLEIAVELTESLINGIPFQLEEKLDEARRIISETELGPSTRAIVNAATARGIPCNRVGNGSVVQLGYGKHRKFIEAALSSNTSSVAVDIAANKELTKRMLSEASIPVPHGETVEDEENALQALQRIVAPVVVKPLDGHQGDGVSLNVRTAEEMKRAFQIARQYSSRVLIEECFSGNDYRVLVVNGRMVAASLRQPCNVVGDGQRTIRELLEIENQNPLRGKGHEKPLTRIVVDSILLSCLEKQGMSLETRPQPGQRVYLLEGANLSKGGTASDVTDLVHPEIAAMCERASRIADLDICGIDLVTEDISQPLRRGGIIELNASPGLRMHLHPSDGEPRDVAAAIVDMLYPSGSPSRVPIISTTGTNGKTTVTRMIGHMLSESGLCVGMTTTDGIYIGSQRIVEGDTTGPCSARTVLADPMIDVAVLETARGGIMRRGLGYDWSDIAIITNIQRDHIGQDGIKNIEDLVFVKSLVAERVRDGGTLILNGDDEQLARLMESPRVNKLRKNVIYFSLSPDQPLIANHLSAGGTSYFVDDGWIVEAIGERREPIININGLSTSLGGAATFQHENALAAIAACRALGLAAGQAASSIANFGDTQHNAGRLNLYQVRGAYVLIDYGHNPRAFESIGKLVSALPLRKVTAVLGVPGDRCDSLIIEAGRKAAEYFQRIIIREDKDLRGRQPGEIPRLLSETITNCGSGKCEIVLDECEALERELRSAEQGDMVVLFYEHFDTIADLLNRLGAHPVNLVEAAKNELDPVLPSLEAESYKSVSVTR